jgi:hypothetical protein
MTFDTTLGHEFAIVSRLAACIVSYHLHDRQFKTNITTKPMFLQCLD